MFDSLVELDAAARAERLEAIGATDPGARSALEELLEADANPASGLGRLDAVFGSGAPPAANERSAHLDMLKLVGQTVSHFRVVAPLAAGGMGVLYRAIDTHLGRAVALKFPLPGHRLDGRVRDRFLREARAASALDHPNICSIYEAGETNTGHLFLAMPLYEGETLKSRIARTGPLSIADSLAIATQIARGLQAAHRAGIVHRDLKPANVMILPDGSVKILDFGVARAGDVTLTKSHDTLGTVYYMAPEQIGGAKVDTRADLWSLGVLLHEMLTGRRPFESQNAIAIAHAIMHSNPDRPAALRPEIPPQLDHLVLGLLAKEPTARPGSADAVATELAEMASQSVSGRATPRLSTFARARRHPLRWASASALMVIGFTAAWLLRPSGSSQSSRPRVVAVLPLEHLGPRGSIDHLPIALADEISAQLSRLSTVAVPGSWFSVAYRGASRPPADIAAELGADAVVLGSVNRTGDEVRLQIEVFDARRNGRVMRHQYSAPVTDVLALQLNAIQRIVDALDLKLVGTERAALRQAPTENAGAYDLYLRGRAAESSATFGNVSLSPAYVPAHLENLQLAQSFYARARDSDPAFPAPRARLAITHLALARNDTASARLASARLEAEAALRLQPGTSEAHEALAAYWSLRRDWLKALAELELALAGRPNAADLYRRLGMSLRELGRWEDALAALERGIRLDPRNRSLRTQAALTYSRLRRYEKSIAHWDQVIAIDSSESFPQIIRGFNYLRLGNVDSLNAAIARIPLGLDGGGMTTYARYTAHRVSGRQAEALASLDSAKTTIVRDGLMYRPITLLRAQTLERMGDLRGARSNYEAARNLLEDSVAANPRQGSIRIGLGLAYAGLNRRADALREARIATEIVRLSDDSPTATAFMGGAVEIYAQLRDADRALELIELLLSIPAGREISVPLLRLDPAFDPLRSDPRFEPLLRRFSGS